MNNFGGTVSTIGKLFGMIKYVRNILNRILEDKDLVDLEGKLLI